MKIFLSFVAFFSIPLVSMQAALANVSEKNVVSKSVTSTSKAKKKKKKLDSLELG